MLDQIEALEELKAAFPEYEAIITEAMFNAQDEIDNLTKGLDEQKEAVDDVKSAWEELGPTFASAFEDAIVEGGNLRDVLQGLEKDIIRIITRKAVTEPLGNAIGGLFSGGGGSGIFSKLFGFASGGSFTVGGSGGTDSQLVAFKASPNERVTVETPGQQSSGGNTYNFSFVLPSDNVNYRKTGQMVAREAARYMQISQGAV